VSVDFDVVWRNLDFLVVGGLLGLGRFGGGTLALAIPTILLALALGVFVALARLSPFAPLRWLATGYVELIRGVPLVMVVFWFWFFIPIATGRPLPNYWVALIAFVIFEAAYIGEIIRAGIQSVPRGQVEAARATALSYATIMGSVVLPQATRNMLPSLVNQFIILFKDTSLASIIGYMDLTKAAKTVADQQLRPFELYIFIAVVYFAFAYSLSLASRALERRLAAGRRELAVAALRSA
jgi:polar amino acid transport system permease protein